MLCSMACLLFFGTGVKIRHIVRKDWGAGATGPLIP